MDRDMEDVARRLEARAFLYRDPGSFREGVLAALREVAARRRAAARTRVGSGPAPRRRPGTATG